MLLLLWLPACSNDDSTGPGHQSGRLALLPVDGSVLTSDFTVTIGTDAVDSMAVYLDDTMLAVVDSPPFTLPVVLGEHGAGEYALNVTVFDGGAQEHLSANILICFGVGLDIGNFAPSCSLEDLQGANHPFRTPPGDRVLLLDFWATWCPPCRFMLPETQRLFEEYGDQGLEVLTISNENEEIVKSFVLENEYTFPVLLDTNDFAHFVFDVRAIPKYFLIDHRGVVRYVQVGTGGIPLEEIILELL
jgi:thiol-disulfide isomerase/thioredoxin